MSNREKQMGERVWLAFLYVASRQTFGGVGGAWTRQIAQQAGVSKPTAQKYMLIARDAGYCRAEVNFYQGYLWLKEA